MGRFIGAIFTTLLLLYFVTYTEGASVMLTTFAILVIWIGARVGTPEHKWVRALAVNLGLLIGTLAILALFIKQDSATVGAATFGVWVALASNVFYVVWEGDWGKSLVVAIMIPIVGIAIYHWMEQLAWIKKYLFHV